MLTNEAYTQFCDFWTAYRHADKYANRRSCTFSQKFADMFTHYCINGWTVA